MFSTLLTHRGIDIPLGKTAANFPMESTWEGFTSQIESGFGLEFDVQPTADGGFAISHESNLGRLTGGHSVIDLKLMPTAEVSDIKVPGGRLCALDELLDYMVDHATAISALHLKASNQTPEILNTLIARLKRFERRLGDRLIIFDAKIEIAKVLRTELPGLQLAASVSDPFDVQRYGIAAGGTLLAPETVLRYNDIYSWVWLDEWDRAGEGGTRKTFVNSETVRRFHAAGFKVAAVSPELHATSPSLLGGEAHEDGLDLNQLQTRWLEWASLELQALCTDHASSIKLMWHQQVE